MRVLFGRVKSFAAAAALVAAAAVVPAAAPATEARAATGTPPQVYGAWHCGNDACTWATVRDMTDFDHNNHWLIDRGDGRPSVNLVILSFVNPLKLLNQHDRRGRHQRRSASA